MKKTFLLLFGLVCSVCANADHDITLYSWSSDADGNVIEGGGNVAYVHGTGDDEIDCIIYAGWPTKTYHTLKVDGKSTAIYGNTLKATSGYLQFTLDEPLEAGDKITITAFRSTETTSNGATLGVLFGSTVTSATYKNTNLCIKPFINTNTKFWPNLAANEDNNDYGNDGNDLVTASWSVTSSGSGSGAVGSTVFNLFEVTSAASLYITAITVTRTVADATTDTENLTCLADYVNTYCYPYTATVSGATFYKFLGKKDGYVYGEKLAEGSKLEAGFPYLFVPTANSIAVVRTDMNESYTMAKNSNGLYGNLGSNKQLQGTDCDKYMIFTKAGLVYITNKNYNTVKKYGCYVVASKIKDYDDETEELGAKAVKLFSVEEESSEATGIAAIQTLSDAAMYNLSGQRIAKAQKGQVYIISGKKYIAK